MVAQDLKQLNLELVAYNLSHSCYWNPFILIGNGL
jgi:CHAT domain-containing protein